MEYRILYNPAAGNGRCREEANLLEVMYEDAALTDLTQIGDMNAFLKNLEPDEKVILCGGDGTLQWFINALDGRAPEREILYYAIGSGNDFARDLGYTAQSVPFPINAYLKDLPRVCVNGEQSYFINGIGFGIDGYCCEEGDRKRARSKKPVNYALIAIKGLFGAFKPTAATVTVDGVRHCYKKVWLAATMNGRFYGGGMMMAPQQSRANREGIVSLVVIHDVGKLRLLSIFPSIFRGEHIHEKDIVAVHTGRSVMVEFEQPKPLQIDGDTVSNIRSYTVQSAIDGKIR